MLVLVFEAVLLREADLSEKHVRQFASVTCVCVCFAHPIKMSLFRKKKASSITVSFVVVGFLLEKVTFLMSSSGGLLQKIMEIVEDVASVAENHGHIRRFRTDNVVRAVIFLMLSLIIFHFSFMLFIFPISFFFFGRSKWKNIVKKFPS